MELSLIGAPTDVGASVAGCRLGPGALRVAGIGRGLTALGRVMTDTGDVEGPPNPMQAPVDGYRHLDEVVAWNIAVRDHVADALAAGRLPVLMGATTASPSARSAPSPPTAGPWARSCSSSGWTPTPTSTPTL